MMKKPADDLVVRLAKIRDEDIENVLQNYIKDDKREYRITSVEGFMGEKRKNECRDPNIVIINVR